MMRRRRNVAVAIGTTLALLGCRTRTAFHEPDPELNRMLQVPRYDIYEQSTFFEDGMTMRVPPIGTQPYGTPTASAYRLGTEDGAFVARFPVPLTEKLIERGRGAFERTCSACHGMSGEGNELVTRMMARPAPSLHLARIRELLPGKIFYLVSNGYGLMPSYSPQLDIEDRWAVVAYVKVLERSQYAPLASMPNGLREEVQRRLR